MSRWKRSLKGVLRSLGLQLRWLPPRYACRQNMFTDQRAILGERGAGLILDVGANVGQRATRYRWLFPNAVIQSSRSRKRLSSCDSPPRVTSWCMPGRWR